MIWIEWVYTCCTYKTSLVIFSLRLCVYDSVMACWHSLCIQFGSVRANSSAAWTAASGLAQQRPTVGAINTQVLYIGTHWARVKKNNLPNMRIFVPQQINVFTWRLLISKYPAVPDNCSDKAPRCKLIEQLKLCWPFFGGIFLHISVHVHNLLSTEMVLICCVFVSPMISHIAPWYLWAGSKQ